MALSPRSSQSTINLIGLGIVLSLFGDGTLYTVLPDPEIAAMAGVSLAVVGVALGLNRLVRVLFNAGAGLLYDRTPRRWLLIGSMALGALSTAVYAGTHGAGPLLAGRVLWGAAWSGLWIGANTAVLDLAQEENRGRLSGRLQMWFFIGAGMASLAGGAFTDWIGFRGGLWLSAGLTGAAALLWLFLLPETAPRHVSLASMQDARSGDRQPARRMLLRAVLIELRSFPWRNALPAAVPVLAIRFVFAGVIASTTILWLSGFVGRELAVGAIVLPLATLTGAFSSLRTVTSVGGAPLAGWISDRLSRRWPVICGALFLGGAGLWLMGVASPGLAFGGALLAAVASGSVQAVAPALTGDRVRAERQSRGLSVIFTFGDLGSALGPPLALGLLPSLGIAGVYTLAASLLLAAALFALASSFDEPRRPHR